MKKIFSKVGLLLCSAAMVGALGVSYAGYTDLLIADAELSTGSMGFEFLDTNKDQDFVIGLLDNSQKGEFIELDANINFDGKSITIAGMDPVDISMLDDGITKLVIHYFIKASEGQSIKKAAAIDKKDKRSSLGEIPFELLSATPQWNIEGEFTSGGSGEKSLGTVPEVIYELLPETLGSFKATHLLAGDEKGDFMQGTILLEPTKNSEILSAKKVALSDFDLPEDLVKEMAAEKNLELSVIGHYGFEIPLVLDQFNAGRE